MKKPQSGSHAQAYVPIYTAYGHLGGEMVRMLLESMGIPTMAQQESAGATLGLTVGPLGEVKILVAAENVRAARDILQAMEDGKLEEPYEYTQHTQSQRLTHNKQDQDERFTKET